MDWLDLLAVQGTLKSLLQHHSSKASILQCSAFFPSNFHTFQGLRVPTFPVPECGAFQGLCGSMCDTRTACLLRPGCCDGPKGESRRGHGAAVTVQGATRLRQQRTNGTYSHFDSGANFLKNEQSELLSTQKLDRVHCRL